MKLEDFFKETYNVLVEENALYGLSIPMMGIRPIILFLNKEHLNNYGYFIHDEEYYINLDFDFLELNDEIM